MLRPGTYAALGAAILVCSATAWPSASPPSCVDCLVTRYWPVQTGSNTPGPAELFRELDTSTGSREAARLASLPNLGVAFSGGGTRAATATLGQLRGLRENGWLDRTRYISAVSGGGWAAIPFTYSREPLDRLLGPHLDPARLTKVEVERDPGGLMPDRIVRSSLMASSIREASLIVAASRTRDAEDGLLAQINGLLGRFRRDGVRESKTFSRLMADTFIDPLIDTRTPTSDRWFTWDEAAFKDITRLNSGQLGNFVFAQPGRPFLVTGAIAVTGTADEPRLTSVEYTPLYVGTRRATNGNGNGAYVWPWAYDPVSLTTSSSGVDAQPDTLHVRIDRNRRFTLADMAASTGAAPELFLTNGGGFRGDIGTALRRAAGFLPSFRHLSFSEGLPVLTNEVPHADGGGLDNLGLMPLLARGVTHALVFINTSTPMAEDNQDLQALFFPIGPAAPAGDKSRNVVFSADRWGSVLRDLITARTEGRPQVSCDADWRVEPNTFYNIKGYDGLSICFFYNAEVPAWERELSIAALELLKETPKDLSTDIPTRRAQLLRAANRDQFPWFKTFFQNKPHFIKLSTTQVTLLSNLSTWVLTNTATRATIEKTMPILRTP